MTCGRNTPALAGTTHQDHSSAPNAREHPRAGGDDRYGEDRAEFEGGTPPRWRGRLLPGVGGVVCPGNTPALAGTTRPSDLR